MTGRFERFITLCEEIHDLQEIQQLLDWDQQVIMPPRGAAQRGHQQAALAALVHQRLTSQELGDLIEEIQECPDLDEAGRADVREARRAYRRAVRVPESLVAARTEACVHSQLVWEEARAKNDFPLFLPHLQKVLALTREMAQALREEGQTLYDALLEDYEPGMTAAGLAGIFGGLRPPLVALLERAGKSSDPPDGTILERYCPRAGQEGFGRLLAECQGYDFTAGRLDTSTHPMTTGTFGDVRITTRYDEQALASSLFGILHETGHALYEQGLSPGRFRRPAGGSCSMGIHESQSRLWENQIGRSRNFWIYFYPMLRQQVPGVMDDVPLDRFHRAINLVRPSLIRVEADEVSYNLHIILRFELEQAMVEGGLEANDLPVAWNGKMEEYLGLRPLTDADGCLQDIHWPAGAFGYFPTYCLGNLYAAQFMTALHRELPGVDEAVAAGRLAGIREWLRDRIHRHGRIREAHQLVAAVTGELPSARPFLDYLEEKFREIYPA